MREAKHTPGPWQIDDGDGGPFSVFDCDGRPLALLEERGSHLPAPQFKDNGYLTWDEHVANARLIAAAPDMLAALKRIIHDWDGEPEDMAEARDAVQKAEGGQS